MRDETLAALTEQVHACIARDAAESWETSPVPGSGEAAETAWQARRAHEAATLLAAAIEVSLEHDEAVPLTETQMTTVHLRASMARAHELTRDLADSLDRFTPERKPKVEAILAAFERSNALMDTLTGDAGRITDDDMRRVARSISDNLKRVDHQISLPEPTGRDDK